MAENASVRGLEAIFVVGWFAMMVGVENEEAAIRIYRLYQKERVRDF